MRILVGLFLLVCHSLVMYLNVAFTAGLRGRISILDHMGDGGEFHLIN